MKRPLFLAALAALGLFACVNAFGEAVPHNVCRLPSVREVRVSPEAAEDGWLDAITWAFAAWKEVVPALAYTITVTPEAQEVTLPCITSFVSFTFQAPEYPTPVFADTRNGVVRLMRKSPLTLEGKRACLLHELGHLLFGFGHTPDQTSIMFRVIQAFPALSEQDKADARTAFASTRDGA